MVKPISCILLLVISLLSLLTYAEEIQEPLVERLINQLQDQDKDIRMNAVRALMRMGKEVKVALPSLISLLQNQNANVRVDAARVLVRIGTPEALKAVEEYRSRQ